MKLRLLSEARLACLSIATICGCQTVRPASSEPDWRWCKGRTRSEIVARYGEPTHDYPDTTEGADNAECRLVEYIDPNRRWALYLDFKPQSFDLVCYRSVLVRNPIPPP
jgi:hypothetical protein